MPDRAPAAASTILVLYESDTVRRALRPALAMTGMDVVEASTMKEAQTAIARAPLALLIIDVQKPTSDGAALAMDFRMTPGLESVPIILLTPDLRMRKSEVDPAAWTTACLTKPVLPGVLRQAVLEALGLG